MDQNAKIKAWQERLEATFVHNGEVGGRFLRGVRQRERTTGATFVDKFHGHRVLTDSFLDFFGQTIRFQSFFNNCVGWPTDQPYYVTSLMMYLTLFRTIRASEILSEYGYVLRAYAIQRSIKEQLWILCAAANGMATFAELFGWEDKGGDWTPGDQEEIFKAQLKTENLVREKIVGAKSELSENSQTQLLNWERLFNKEVHRALFSMYRASHRLIVDKKYDVSLGPTTDDLADAMFLNRSMELNWMALRLLPFMRRSDTPTNERWAANWRVLDESFKFMFDGFSALGKAIAPAYLELIETKFSFDPSKYFAEPKKVEPKTE